MLLSSKTSFGVIWNFAQQLASKGTGVVVTLGLAYFLTPVDFGLVAMISIFIALGGALMESGFREALIRLKQVSQTDYTTAFYINVGLSFIAYAILFICSPYIAKFYNEAKLTNLIRFASLSIIISSFQIVQLVELTRELNFKRQLKASLPASIISGLIAIYLAYINWGVWALVSQTLINSFIHTVILWRIQGWRPTLEFDINSAKNMYFFGYKLFISGTIDKIFQNLYIIVIAKVFSAPVAGLYFFANKIKDLLISQLVYSIQTVTYPALSSIQDDNLKLKIGYKNIVIMMTMLLYPIVLTIAALASPIFDILLPQKWHHAVSYFQLLCISSLLIPLHSINLNILKVKGRSDLFLYLELLKKSVITVILFLTYKHGIHAIIYGQMIASIINYIPNSYFSKELIGYRLQEQISDFLPTLIISSIAAYTGYLLVGYIELSPLLILVITTPIVMILLVVLNLLFNRKRVDLTFSYILKIIPGKLLNQIKK